MIEDGTVTVTQFANTTITSADMALDPRDADNISSGSVPLAQLDNVPAVDLTGLDNDIALLGFKAAAQLIIIFDLLNLFRKFLKFLSSNSGISLKLIFIIKNFLESFFKI